MGPLSVTMTYTSLEQIEGLVGRFEAVSLSPGEWNHTTHLTIGLWYLLHHPEYEAAARTIDGIRAHNRLHGVQQGSDRGYHETVTLFWLAVTRRFLDREGRGDCTLDLMNAFVSARAHQSPAIFEFYTRARLRSWKARYYWLEPDLRSLDSI